MQAVREIIPILAALGVAGLYAAGYGLVIEALGRDVSHFLFWPVSIGGLIVGGAVWFYTWNWLDRLINPPR
jgi:hypothetical protein